MDAAQPVPKTPASKTWATMDGAAKAIFVAKVSLMVCSFGYLFGGALVDGMVYEKLPDAGA